MSTERRNKLMGKFEKLSDFTHDKITHGIEEYRKGFVFLNLHYADGTPVKNAEIHVSLKEHEFKYGANLFMLKQFETAEKNRIYEETFKKTFNMATLPFYWDANEPEKGNTRYSEDSEPIYRRPPIDTCMNFCEKNGIEPREHGLAYDHFFPKWLHGADERTFKIEYERRCSEIAELYANRIPTIEVTNEMMWPSCSVPFYYDPKYITWCFQTAEKYFPNNELVINEGSVSNEYKLLIQQAIANGARIDAVAIQRHMFSNKIIDRCYDPIIHYKELDKLASIGKPVQISEVTIPSYSWDEEDEQLQADIIEELYSMWFSYPQVEQIVYWNLVDGYAYSKEGPAIGNMTSGENAFYGGLMRFDCTPKPALLRIQELFGKRWRTDTTIIVNDGEAFFKGFYGKYEIKIKIGSTQIVKEINFSKKGINEIDITV